MVLDGLDDTTIRCIATWIEHGTYNMPTYAPAISALENPSAHVQRLTAMHRENIVGDNDGCVFSSSTLLSCPLSRFVKHVSGLVCAQDLF